MNLRNAERMIRAMMNTHGLTDWRIAWSRSKKTHGRCIYNSRTLEFSSAAFAIIGEDEVRETVLHEIAHALAGHAAGHGYQWLRVYRQIGGTGGAYVSQQAAAAIRETAAWEGRCSKGHTVKQHRAPLRVKACGQCSGTWKVENILTWHQHGTKIAVSNMPVRYRNEYTMIINRAARV